MCCCGGCEAAIAGYYDKDNVLAGNCDEPVFHHIHTKEDLLKNMKNWKSGDIILQHHFAPHQIILTNSPWTHVAVIYKRDELNSNDNNNNNNNNGDTQSDDTKSNSQNTDKENNNDDNELFDEFGRKEDKILSLEAVLVTKDGNDEFHKNVNRFAIISANKWVHTAGGNSAYIAHRSLKKALTKEQLKKFRDSVNNNLKGKPYGGFTPILDDEAYCAAIDCGCCPKKKRNYTIKDRDLRTLYCSEATGVILQDIGLLSIKASCANEYVPGDFSSDKITMYANGKQDPYEQEVVYAYKD